MTYLLYADRVLTDILTAIISHITSQHLSVMAVHRSLCCMFLVHFLSSHFPPLHFCPCQIFTFHIFSILVTAINHQLQNEKSHSRPAQSSQFQVQFSNRQHLVLEAWVQIHDRMLAARSSQCRPGKLEPRCGLVEYRVAAALVASAAFLS